MPELPLVGEEFAGYRLTAILGRGGMSVVYRAENPRLGNEIALKVLDPSLANDDIFRARFLEESRIAASMNHPNVIPIHDMGSAGGLLYIAMRCVTGTDLRQMLKKRGRLQPETSVFLLDQAARALDAAHRRGLVHRDVKPGNLLVERGNEGADPEHVYLADFGITKHLGGRTGLTSTGQFLGTIDYVAPEQIRGTSVLGYADQYSLGCVLYECLTGRVPFEKDLDAAIIWAHVEEAPTMPTVLRPDLPLAIDDVFARVLAKTPGDRFDSCKDFVAAAREALGRMAEPPGGGSSLPPFASPFAPTAASADAEVAHETRGARTRNWAPLESDWSGAEATVPPPLEPLPPLEEAARGPYAGSGPRHGGGPGSGWPPAGGGPTAPARRRGPSGMLLAGIIALVVVVAGAAAITLAVARGGAAAGSAGPPTVSGAPTNVGTTMPNMGSTMPGMGASPSGSAVPLSTIPPATMAAATARSDYCSPSGAEAADAQNEGMSGPTSLKDVLELANLCSTPQNAISPNKCTWTSATLATCAAPSAGVASVMFETYPTAAAQYSAYETQIEDLDGGTYQQNTKSACNTGTTGYSETGWNHEDGHPASYTVAQLESPSFNPVFAMGRQACFMAGGRPYLIWTSDNAHLLAVATGASAAASMKSLYNWWGDVHHVILFPKTEMCGQNMLRMADAPQGNLITVPQCPAGVQGDGM